MRWSAIWAPLKHLHSANLNHRNKISFSTLRRRVSLANNPSVAQAAGKPSTSHDQARSSSQSFAIAQSGNSPSSHAAEVGNASSCQAKTAPIRSSSKTIAISENKDSSSKSADPSRNICRAEERARSSTLEEVKREAGRRETLSQVKSKPLEASSAKVKASSKPVSAHFRSDGRHIYEANALSSNHAKGLTLNQRPGSGSPLAEEDACVGVVGLYQDITASSATDTSQCNLANPSIRPEGSATLEDKEQAGSKKPSFEVRLPVAVVLEWWFSCFVQGDRPYYTSLNHPFNKVYVWLAAYQRAHFDATGHYADSPNAAGLMGQLLDLQNAVLDGKFQWGHKKLVYLPMPVGDKEESLSDMITFPSFQDRVVHEILYLVLEPIFESRFSARSHGFRPGRDAHTALRATQRHFQGCTWFVCGNLSFLHEEIYACHLVDSALRVVRDTRINFLLKSGFLAGMSEQEESTGVCMFAGQGSCSKLRNLLCNVFLDQLDWLMDEQISRLLKREQPSTRSSSNLLFKPERVRGERSRKLEYVRYGTDFVVACNGTKEEAELVANTIKIFFKQKSSLDVGKTLTISHISDGVKFLDHSISQKIVHPIISRRRASNGRVFEKRAHRIRLCIKASRECCLMYLEEIKTPTSLQQIVEMLLVLDNWYHYAENKEKVMQYCKLALCNRYAEGVIAKEKEGSMDFSERFKEATRMVVDGQMKQGDSNKANLLQDFFWIPEHEKVLRDQAWMQSKSLMMTKVAASFKNVRKVSPQEDMSHVLWQYLGADNRSNGNNNWEPDAQMQTSSGGQEFMVDTKLEDFAESVG